MKHVHAAVQSDRGEEHERELQRVPRPFRSAHDPTTEELKKSYCLTPYERGSDAGCGHVCRVQRPRISVRGFGPPISELRGLAPENGGLSNVMDSDLWEYDV